ncbi:two-component regulator propeller domain-containing protein [Hymenobacter sp. ASUV-10]|uniref:Two-component regulator propeller domain-containing protein n=1 Tax=Hymenobacter aranciens TaxID=3063996 RepID=A0ABT9BFJ3_9BACT|nr:two-component regulator propeller domain-containing protein [Hymenobacter sp. ASUV-10]MDO7877007.1 two-component regulator propeller domain-containing protein [Hymenobacter sp. ASUV-10]
MTHVFRSFCFFLSLVLLSGMVRAQSVGYGDWQLHLPANRPLYLADAGDRIYVGTESSFYFLDKAQNTTHMLSRRDGLSDVNVAGLDYDPATKQTVVVYRNNNIDIIQPNGKVRNLNDVARKAISGTRNVNQVKVLGDRAYIATDFGLVVVNLTKLEIADTYSTIGANGAQVQTYSVTTAHDTLFVSTSEGLLRGRLSSSVNLLDYRNWTKMPAAGSRPRHILATLNGTVYAGSYPEGVVYAYAPRQNSPAGGTWLFAGYGGNLFKLRTIATGLLLLGENADVQLLSRGSDGSFSQTVLIPKSTAGIRTYDGLRADDGSYYIADYNLGFRHIVPGPAPTVELFQPNGPQGRLGFSILADSRSNTVDVFAGLYSDRYAPQGSGGAFYEYALGQWTNYTRQSLPSATDLPQLRDFVRGARTLDGSTLYIGSYGDGLVRWNGVGNYEVFDARNSILKNATTGPDDKTCYIGDLATAADGSIWLTNRHGLQQTSGLFRLDPSTSPPTLTSPTAFREGMQILDRLALDDNGFVWASVSRKTDGTSAAPGIIAVDPVSNQTKHFSSADGLPSNEVYDIVKDQTGDIWAATLLGVARLSGPGGAFLSEVSFLTPNVTRGEGAGFPALWNTAVRAMAVDGANRKWFGTDEGLWLFSADANEALLHFTTDNSPLPSNRIVDVAVNDRTGDVWVSTDGGVVSYRGSATITEGKPNCTKVSPNPVRPDYTGVVGVSGLANNALVKITDVAGHLVYATTATGGTLTWNMTDANGQRVRSGVYLVLSSDADGGNTCVSKVAVLSK